MADSAVLRPTPLEIASGVVPGRLRTPPAAHPPTVTALTALTALERSVLPALHRPPCLVSFSGGVDSSFVLAVAARVARRDGLPAPVPVTWRFTGAPRAEESSWQERVVAALPVEDWPRLHADDDLDLIGPVAQRVLTRYGVLHPVNVHLHLPIIELAAGGSLLTGVGGDQILSGWRRPGPRPAAPTLRARLPGRLVASGRQRRGQDPFPWLHPAVSRRVFRTYRAQIRSEPRRIGRRIGWHAQRRDLLMSCSSLHSVAADHHVRVVNPLLDPQFLAALREEVGGARGLTRCALLAAIAGRALPAAATAPRPKARFLEVFLRAPTRDFARSWDGRGAEVSLVNAAALGELWSRWPIPAGTAGLVQQLWLSTATRPSPTAQPEAQA